MTSYIVFVVTVITGIISVLYSGISAMHLIFKRRRREKLTRQVILLCHKLTNPEVKGKSSSDTDEQIQNMILEMLQPQNQKQIARQVDASNLSKRRQLLESGYSSKKTIKRVENM